ncbi:mechanosensitive ion channel family protein [Roseateles sp. DC23W]|uniref:Mechanosensitive ion channel family protein n=1 Tax=Pelomonas dachongensis TaxID=3299029 RepID=A0ABW7ELD4_9BURK
MNEPLNLHQLQGLLRHAFSTDALVEWALLLSCLLLAGGISWALSRAAQRHDLGVLFGRRVLDGALFPVLAVALAFVARRLLPLWDLPPAVFRLVLPLLVSLAVIRLVARVLAGAFPASRVIKSVERIGSWLIWLAAVLWVTGLLPVLLDELDHIGWKVGSVQLTLRNLIEGVLTSIVVLLMALWLSSAIEARLMKRESLDMSMRKIAANAVRALLLFIGLMFALSAAGIDLTALGVLGGALGVGLGFGLQKLAANYVSGFVILAERSLRIGDMVKVDNFEGRVTDITTRYTVIRSLGGREAIVPNEMLITQCVENSSLADPRVLLSTTVQVDYDCAVDRVMESLAAAAGTVSRVLSDPGPSVQLTRFADSGIELTVYFWIMDPENGSGGVRSNVNLAIWRTLKELGVDIPYPQQVQRQPKSVVSTGGEMPPVG